MQNSERIHDNVLDQVMIQEYIIWWRTISPTWTGKIERFGLGGVGNRRNKNVQSATVLK